MVAPDVHSEPYDSAHHVDTSEGDSFGGMGTSREYREEEIPRLRTLANVFDLVQKPDDGRR
jgi:hypothetical protein